MSHDTKTWTSVSLPIDSTFTVCQIIYKNGQFILVGTDIRGGEVLTSPDGVNWSVRTVQGQTVIEAVG